MSASQTATSISPVQTGIAPSMSLPPTKSLLRGADRPLPSIMMAESSPSGASTSTGGFNSTLGARTTSVEKFASSSSNHLAPKKSSASLNLNTHNIALSPTLQASHNGTTQQHIAQRPPAIAIRPTLAPSIQPAPPAHSSTSQHAGGHPHLHQLAHPHRYPQQHTHSLQSHVPSPPINVSNSNQPIKTKMSMASVVSLDPAQPQLHSTQPAVSLATSTSTTGPGGGPQQLVPMGPPKVSITSKEWVIPPRPKPGRKPATDTPPSKRKAQNRAAQRAFRERRAARVGELEEQIEEQKQIKDRIEHEMMDKIRVLELELQSYQSRCSLLENLLDRERQDRIKAETGLLQQQQQQCQNNLHGQQSDSRRQSQARFSVSSVDPRGSSGLGNHPVTAAAGPHTTLSASYDGPNILADDNLSPPSFVMSSMLPPPNPASVGAPGTYDLSVLGTCGGCQPTGPCACVEEALAKVKEGGENMCLTCSMPIDSGCICNTDSTFGVSASSTKRARSPHTDSSNKRQQNHSLASNNMEMDMNTVWKREASPLPMQSLPNIIAPKDKCGFCDSDESICPCANPDLLQPAPPSPPLAPAQPAIYQAPSPPGSEASPPPMEITSTGAVKLRPFNKKTAPSPTTLPKPSLSGCGPNGPGTCAQCKADPKSGLFCRSLAANFERTSGSGSGGCCGGGGAGGGCCKSKQPAQPPTGSAPQKFPNGISASSIAAKAQFGLSISCADAYKTLASHRNFDRAADEISTWLPKLRAAIKPGESSAAAARRGNDDERTGRLPIEVEAASIMSVLKDFDVRFQGQLPP